MTTKQIAQAIGKPEKTVRTWAAKVVAKSAEAAAKMAEATSTRPADWELEETIAIIEIGLGKNAAALFAENANRKGPDVSTSRLDRLEGMVEKLCMAVASIPATIQALQPRQIEFIQDYFTIKGYASKIGQQIAFSEAIAIGREAAKLSREKGVEVRKADDERFGQVNSYAIAVLHEVFQS